MGIILKPREFQRLTLVSIGDKQMADEMDSKGQVFGSTDKVDPVAFSPDLADDRLSELLNLTGMLRARSIASPALTPRVTIIRITARRLPEDKKVEQETDPFMKKLAAAYNGYRQELIKKASVIENCITLDPQLRADLFGPSMAEAFAGGVEKVATSALGPESLAYLVGAFQQDRDFPLANEAAMSLARMGHQEAAA